MSKYEDGKLLGMHWEDWPGYEVIKGWHDLGLCQSEVKGEYGDDLGPVIKIEHKYGFWGIGRNELDDPCQYLYERDEPGRGRFKITLAYTGVGVL